MAYRCVATSVAGFVQQLAVAYVAHGYWFYVTGRVPPGKDPADVDRKLVDRYAIDQSKWARARAKRAGRARVQYLRFDRYFILLATQGAPVLRRGGEAGPGCPPPPDPLRRVRDRLPKGAWHPPLAFVGSDRAPTVSGTQGHL